MLRGNRLGSEAFARYYPFEPVGLSPQNRASVPAEPSKWRSQPAQEQFDVVLYVGPPSVITYIADVLSAV
jgi:hypothetical protein